MEIEKIYFIEAKLVSKAKSVKLEILYFFIDLLITIHNFFCYNWK